MKALRMNEVPYCMGSEPAMWANCRAISVLGSKPKATIANEYTVFVSTFFNWSDKFIFSSPKLSTSALMMAIAGRSSRLWRSVRFELMLSDRKAKYAEVADVPIAIAMIASTFLRAHFEITRMWPRQWLGGINATGILLSAGTAGLFGSLEIGRRLHFDLHHRVYGSSKHQNQSAIFCTSLISYRLVGWLSY